MKDSAKYEKKIRKILSQARKAAPAEVGDSIRLMLTAVLEEDTTQHKAAAALKSLEEEYVDHNELRVSPIKDIVECLGRGFPGARAKAVCMTEALHAVFERANMLSLDFLAKRTKRDIRKALRENVGLSPYAESVMTLFAFDGHAIPVDNLLLEALKLEGCIHPDSDVPDLQGFLERIIPGKDACGCHFALRAYVGKAAPKVAKEIARREAKARAEAEAKAIEEAKAREAAEAQARAKAEKAAQEKAAAEAKAAAKAEAKKKSPVRKAAKAKKVARVVKSRKATAAKAGKGKPSKTPAAAKKKKKKPRSAPRKKAAKAK